MSALWSFLRLLRGRSGFAAVVQTGVATVLVLAINVVTGIVSARCLGAQGRGELSALLLCPQFLSFLFTLGLPASTIVKIKSSPASASGLMAAALLLSGLMGLLAAATGILIMPWLLRHYSPHLVSVARGLLVFVMLGVASTVLASALQLSDRFVAYNRMRFWQSALTLLGLVGLAALGAFTPVTGALAYLAPTVPFLIWNLWWVLKEFRPRLAGWPEHGRALLAYGWRVHAMDIGNTLFGQLDKIILVTVLSPASFGIYVVVFNLSRLVSTFASSTIPVLLAKTAGQSSGTAVALTSRALTPTAALSCGAIVVFLLAGGVGLRWVYGAQFGSGYQILVVLAVEAAVAGAATVLQVPYVVLNRPGAVAAFQAINLVLAAVLVYCLGVRFGAPGAACALLMATGVRCALTYGGYGWLLRTRAPRLLPTRTELLGLLSRARASLA